MTRQAQMLAEEGNDVSSRVMMEALSMLAFLHGRHQALKNAVEDVYQCNRLCDSINYKGAPAGTMKKRARAWKVAMSITRSEQ
jgi:hypothetical protein